MVQCQMCLPKNSGRCEYCGILAVFTACSDDAEGCTEVVISVERCPVHETGRQGYCMIRFPGAYTAKIRKEGLLLFVVVIILMTHPDKCTVAACRTISPA